MKVEQDWSGSQLSPGTTRCLQLHFKGPKFQLWAENPTKSALAGLLRLASAKPTANGMDPLLLLSAFGTMFEWPPAASRHQMVSPPGPPQRPAGLQLSAENQRKLQSQAHHARHELKPAG